MPRSVSEGPTGAAPKFVRLPHALTMPTKDMRGVVTLPPLPLCYGEDGPFVLLVLGAPGVGRTALLESLLQGSKKELRVNDQEESTPPFTLTVMGVEYPLLIRSVAIAADTKMSELCNAHKPHACIAIYDITDSNSYTALTDWWQRNAVDNIPAFCVGNKVDERDDREVPNRKSKQWAQLNGLQHIEISAKTSENVDSLMVDIFGHLVDAQKRYVKEIGLVDSKESGAV